MNRESFYGPYRSHSLTVGEHRYYVRGHSPTVQAIFHPNRGVHEFAQWKLTEESRYDHRWRWWSLSVPPPLFTMHVEKVEAPEAGGHITRSLARLIALYAVWKSVPR